MQALHRVADAVRERDSFRFVASSLEFAAHWVGDMLRLISDEHAYNTDLPLLTRIGLWRRGFLSHGYEFYSLDENDPADFMSHYQHRRVASRVNRHASDLLDHKIIFQRYMGGEHEDVLPDLRGYVHDGVVHQPDGEKRSFRDWVTSQSTGFVVKRSLGGQGSYVYVVNVTDDELEVNRGVKNAGELADEVESGDWIITDLIEQADYAAEIFPDSVNTLRLTTLLDSETGDPFIASAVHRFGTDASAPVDNWSGGGACARVDAETGVLTKGAAFPEKGTMHVVDKHPNTGAQMTDVEIPRWEMIRDRILQLADEMRITPYIAWDVVLTDDGIQILEVNDRPDPNLIQIHQGLFEDPRVKRSLYDHL
ncbi:sugar-transfer associated ATP-grasp domain-containing protein [Halalkalicoccus ordinarius]|uniref:sugar-transfer associated ATP-grasp domain-containing protein n=1 Tax=Halalkalicoccus ordinarius TaxID=3116651 RepID=UPI00300ED052